MLSRLQSGFSGGIIVSHSVPDVVPGAGTKIDGIWAVATTIDVAGREGRERKVSPNDLALELM